MALTEAQIAQRLGATVPFDRTLFAAVGAVMIGNPRPDATVESVDSLVALFRANYTGGGWPQYKTIAKRAAPMTAPAEHQCDMTFRRFYGQHGATNGMRPAGTQLQTMLQQIDAKLDGLAAAVKALADRLPPG